MTFFLKIKVLMLALVGFLAASAAAGFGYFPAAASPLLSMSQGAYTPPTVVRHRPYYNQMGPSAQPEQHASPAPTSYSSPSTYDPKSPHDPNRIDNTAAHTTAGDKRHGMPTPTLAPISSGPAAKTYGGRYQRPRSLPSARYPSPSSYTRPQSAAPSLRALSPVPAPAGAPTGSQDERKRTDSPAKATLSENQPDIPSPHMHITVEDRSSDSSERGKSADGADNATTGQDARDAALEVPEADAVYSDLHPGEVVEPEPKPSLSDETKQILSALSDMSDKAPALTPKQFSVNRYDPEIEGILNAPIEQASPSEQDTAESAEDDKQEDAQGVQIQVRKPTLNADYELERAYNALISGQSDVAIEIYKRILKQAPSNQDALFGIATTYHRLGEIDLARPFYARLLNINPDHRDALNNFLVLVADEAPEEALRQMEMLEDKNPDFSPLQAQMSILYQKLDNPDAARRKMARAVSLAPENLAYKFNQIGRAHV